MTQSNISVSIAKEQVAELPVVAFHGRITVVETIEDAMKALAYLRRQKMVGLDTETKPSFKKGQINKVSLVQISSRRHCFLFRLKKIGFCEPLKRFFENEKVTKIGLSLHDDFHVLHRIADFSPKGFVELQSFVKQYGIIDSSLQKIYAILFNERISKGQRLSNWEASTLSDGQKNYAAIDAWSCLRIYEHLSDGKFDPAKSIYRVAESDATEEISDVLASVNLAQ